MVVQNMVHGLTALGSPQAILYLVIGALIGMVVGAIPGLGGAVVLSLILPFVHHFNLTATLCLFLGVHAGSYFAASVTSILLNTPAHPEAFAVTFDGFPMARRGEAGRALGISAAATCLGGFVGCAVLLAFIPVMDKLPNLFHPPEYIALVVIAMLLVGTLGAESVSKALISAGIGLGLATIGPSSVTGTFRYTFGSVDLYAGVSLVAVALGSFAIPQLVMVFGTGTSTAKQDMTGREVGDAAPIELGDGRARQVLGGVLETFRHWALNIQSGIVGALAGIIPGIGGFAANFLSYGIAQQTHRRRKLFGTGIAEGIIAPEGSSLAKEAGSMIPILGLGIPGGVGGALFIAALSLKGVAAGYGFSTSYPTVPYEIVWILALSGLIGTVAGALIAPSLARMTKVPGPLLLPIIMGLAVTGQFVSTVSFFSVIELVVFALIGLILRRLRYSLSSFAVGLVLGPTLETNVALTRNLYPGITFLRERPLADLLFLIAIGIVVLKYLQIRRERAAARLIDLNEAEAAPTPAARASIERLQQLRRVPFPVLSIVTTVCLFAISTWFVIYGATRYNFATAIMPVISGIFIAVPAMLQLPGDIRRYLRVRKLRPTLADLQTDTDSGGLGGLPPDDLPVSLPGEDRRAAAATLSAAAGSGGGLLLTVMEPPAAVIEPQILSRVKDKSWGWNGQYLREIGAFAWLIGFIFACYLVGFVWATPIFVMVYGLTCTRHYFKTRFSWLAYCAISAAVLWGATYGMFHALYLVFYPLLNI